MKHFFKITDNWDLLMKIHANFWGFAFESVPIYNLKITYFFSFNEPLNIFLFARIYYLQHVFYERNILCAKVFSYYHLMKS